MSSGNILFSQEGPKVSIFTVATKLLVTLSVDTLPSTRGVAIHVRAPSSILLTSGVTSWASRAATPTEPAYLYAYESALAVYCTSTF
jgi:hypothetical protein